MGGRLVAHIRHIGFWRYSSICFHQLSTSGDLVPIIVWLESYEMLFVCLFVCLKQNIDEICILQLHRRQFTYNRLLFWIGGGIPFAQCQSLLNIIHPVKIMPNFPGICGRIILCRKFLLNYWFYSSLLQ